MGRDRNAVAAAAEESEALDAWFFRKAWAAADAAEGLAVDPLRGGFDVALLLLFPNMLTVGQNAFDTSADQGLMRILSH